LRRKLEKKSIAEKKEEERRGDEFENRGVQKK